MQKNFILLGLLYLFLQPICMQASQSTSSQELSRQEQSIQAQRMVTKLFENKDISRLDVPGILQSVMQQYPSVTTVAVQGTLYTCCLLKGEFRGWTSDKHHHNRFTGTPVRELIESGELRYRNEKDDWTDPNSSKNLSSEISNITAPFKATRATRRQRDGF